MTVHSIEAGPGAADLLTVRAVRLIRESPVCLYAGTYLDPEVLAQCGPDAELVDTQHLDLDDPARERHHSPAEIAGRSIAMTSRHVVWV